VEKSKKQRAYTKEFKEEAIKLAMKAVSYAQVAKNLGIPEATLYGWLEKVKKTSSAGSNSDYLIGSKALLEENKRLAKALAQAQEEAALLKKAAAYFAQHLK
jgi:transposase